MSKEMMINVSAGEECRIAVLENGRLQELYMERTSATSHVGNIYKGRVTNVESSIQAAFVDFGLGRNGFLHISDLMPSYFGRDWNGDTGDFQESVGRKLSRRDRPPIQRCLRRGDEVIVQIIKEGIGTKGPTLSTYVSIPGRILVMMPGMGKFGVSRKIEDDEERRRLRMILDGLKPIKDVGFIIRTAGIGKTQMEIERDLTYLTRLWENIQKKLRDPAPVELYTEGDLVTRTVRDVFSTDLKRIVVDNLEVAKRIQEFFKIAMPRNRSRIEFYESPVPLFHQANIEREIELMNSRHVPLPSGGSLVIDSTEAVVAIDVNSGKFRDHSDAEMTAFKTDMEAADEIPRQLKLRDLGGVIICDFIDLRFERHRRELEERLHSNFKNDRAKTKVLRMSQFGIIELTRQRMRPSLKRSIYFDCPHCKGAGLVKTPESMSLNVMRRLAIAAYDARVSRIELTLGNEVGEYVLNKKRAELTALEQDSGRRIVVRQAAAMALDDARLRLFDTRDGNVFLEELGMDPNELQDDPHRPPARARRDRRGGRGRPLPMANASAGHDNDADEFESTDGNDTMEDEYGSSAALSAPPPLKPRIVPRVALGRVVGTVLTDGDESMEERESSVIEVDEPNEPLGDGPEEFESDRWQGNDRHRSGARNAGPRNAGPRNDGPRNDGRRNDGSRNEGPRRDGQRPGAPGAGRWNNRSEPDGNRSGNDQPPIDDRDELANGENRNDEGGHNEVDNGENGPRRRRRRGRRGRGTGVNAGPNAEHPDQDRPSADRDPHADDAFGTSADHPDSVGMAGEEIDADAIDAEFAHDGEPTPGNEAPGSEGARDEAGDFDPNQPRKRRRRRGGRRHRRRQDGEPSSQANGPAPVGDRLPQDDATLPFDEAEAHADSDEDDDEEVIGGAVADENAHDDDRVVPVTPFPAVASDEFDDARDEMNDNLETVDPSSTTLAARQIEAGITTEPDAAAEPAADAKPLRGRGRSTARGRGKSSRPSTLKDQAIESAITAESEAVAEDVSDESEPAGKSRRRRPAPRRAPRKAPDAEAPAPIVDRSGSTDRHLVDDIPVEVEPPPRPRSYQDLDAVPDDYD